MFLSQSFPLVHVHIKQWYLKVQVSRCARVQRKFIKFRVIYQTLAVSSKGMKIRIRIWNKFKTKKEVLKINQVTHADIGSPVSFWLLQRDKVCFLVFLFLFLNWTQVIFHKETSCSLITGNLHYVKTVFHQNWFALQLQCCIPQSMLHRSHSYSAVWCKKMTKSWDFMNYGRQLR